MDDERDYLFQCLEKTGRLMDMEVVDGFHKICEGKNGGVPIIMPKGSVVFFTQGVWHWQGDRTAPGDRVTLHMHFNRGILRSLEPKLPGG